MPDLARLHQLVERADDLLHRHLGLVEVGVVEVDVVGAQAAQREASAAALMFAALRPGYSGCWLTLVARTTSPRLPRRRATCR